MAATAPTGDLTTLLGRLAQDLSGQLDLDRLLEAIVDDAMQATGARYGALGVISPDRESLVRFIHRGLDRASADAIGAPPTGGGLLGALIRDPRPRVVDHLPDDPSFQGFPANHPPMETFMGTPIRVAGKVFGNLYLTDKEGGFTDADLRAATILAAVAGMAIHAAEMSHRLQVLAIDEERQRISRDLHDGVIQRLFSAGMGLEAARGLIGVDDEGLDRRLDGAVTALDDTIREIRSTIFTLRPGDEAVSLQDGLVELVREHEAGGSSRPSLNVSQSLDDVVDEQVIPDVLHVVREALSNAARHAGTEDVTIGAEVEDGVLTVEVRDRGAGFDTDLLSPGRGLDTMAERAELVGGHLTVSSRRGAGTTVTLALPVSPAQTMPLQIEDQPEAP